MFFFSGWRWSETDWDGRIAVPFTFHENFPEIESTRIRSHLWRTNRDLGCLKFKYISRERLFESARLIKLRFFV